MAEASAIDYRALKARGFMKQREGELFSVRLGITGGCVTAEHMKAIGQLAATYGSGVVHLTTRQGVEIQNVPYGNLEAFERDLVAAGLGLGLTGPRVRGIVACPGDICQHGLVDPQRVARMLESTVGRRTGLPHKFKIAITGCPNGCAKPIENDLGVMGTGKGYRVYVGGRMGKKARLGDRLPFNVEGDETLVRVINGAIDWYCEHADGRERFGATIDRVGLGSLVQRLEAIVG